MDSFHAQSVPNSSAEILASLCYLKRDPLYLIDKPYVCLIDVSGISDAAATNIVPTDVPNIPIRDVRMLTPTGQPLLTRQGFEVALLNPRPDPKRFADREWVTGDFYMRAGEIVLEKTGARDARVLEHQV